MVFVPVISLSRSLSFHSLCSLSLSLSLSRHFPNLKIICRSECFVLCLDKGSHIIYDKHCSLQSADRCLFMTVSTHDLVGLTVHVWSARSINPSIRASLVCVSSFLNLPPCPSVCIYMYLLSFRFVRPYLSSLYFTSSASSVCREKALDYILIRSELKNVRKSIRPLVMLFFFHLSNV